MTKDLENDYQQNLEQRRGRRRRRRICIGVLFALAAILVSAGSWYVLSGKFAQRRYEEYMDEGNRYLVQLDYEAAEIAYKNAIEAVPDQADAYEKLSNVYLAQGRYEEAGKILATGIRYTSADSLVKTYQRVSALLKNMQDGVSAEDMTAEELLQVSEYITLDSTIYDIVASYRYEDFVRRYGEPISVSDNAYGGRDFRFDGFSGNVSFRTASYKKNRADAVSFESMSDLLGNYGGAASAEKLQELFGSEKSVTASEAEDGSAKYEVSFTYHGCRIKLASDEDGNVYGNAENVLSPVSQETEDGPEADGDTRGQRTASGYIINAVNGGGVAATLRFLQGGRYGTAKREIVSSSDGSFTAKLEPGHYTLEISAEGFINSYEEIQVSSALDLKGLNFALSPELESGEIRIVLTWGEMPRDLDSHLVGTDSDGERVEVNFYNMKSGEAAALDIDDRSGSGPETTTIYDMGGNYNFQVHNFSEDSELADSGAVVRIYLPGQEPVTFEVPSGEGIWWDVCTIEDGRVIPVNVIEE